MNCSMSSGSDYNIHSVITKVDKPVCIFGDGCLIKLHNEEHSHNYDHAKRRFLPKCMQDPECKYYRDVRGFIMNGGGYVTKELKYAQNHVALCYHSPIYTNFISNHRSRRSVSTNINPFLKKTEVPKLGTNKLDKIDEKNRKYINKKYFVRFRNNGYYRRMYLCSPAAFSCNCCVSCSYYWSRNLHTCFI